MVRSEIEKGRGTQFNPEIADLMLQIMEEDAAYQLKQNDISRQNILAAVDEDALPSISQGLAQENSMYHVIGCGSEKELLELLEKQSVQLVLLDIEMPGMHGLETLERICGYEIPVVFMTSDKNMGTLRKAEAMGADDFLTKPFPPLQLNEIVHSILGD
ncbi:MAG: response regulator transcription factor [Anaerovoracaceae bacterium]